MLLLTLFITTMGMMQASSVRAAPGDLLWSDEFDTFGADDAPDETVWNHDVGGGGWGNDEFQEYTSSRDNSRIDKGALHIVAQKRSSSDTTFTSARLKTAGKLYVQYGTIEASIQMPDVSKGLWAAFWTLGQSFAEGLQEWPDCGESQHS